ncbi:hypothetical protein AXW67_25775 [Bradyrhizobium neotropicale]|uniref:Uncharacterized protein n=1 Tax=Bradyrhizobium neotropicale TaxID=1497615 RepID=A0A176YU78_9BRAD|nr:hypothetical protein AXW67_25775 [Bradyrhizobium neotropicale]
MEHRDGDDALMQSPARVQMRPARLINQDQTGAAARQIRSGPWVSAELSRAAGSTPCVMLLRKDLESAPRDELLMCFDEVLPIGVVLTLDVPVHQCWREQS